MATRREINQQKMALSHALREQYRAGVLLPGQPAPSLRQLAGDYGISTRVANGVLQELVAEGLFHMVPRVGTFVGQAGVSHAEFYLMLLPDEYGLSEREDMVQIQHGFEERIAEKGSASLVMPLHRALGCRARGELPLLGGVFDMAFHPGAASSWGVDEKVARVGFSGRVEDARCDEISYDDEGGGHLAARHLIELGHRGIAFLALHAPGDQEGELIWSRERAQGWREALHASGLAVESLLFCPRLAPRNHAEEQTRVGRELGRQILARPDITAVLAANDYAALGLMEAARARGLAPQFWPSIVGFDNRATANGHLVTSLRLPAEPLGRAAADLLWERHHQILRGAPLHRRVPMRLIPRLSSRRDGAHAQNNAMLAAL